MDTAMQDNFLLRARDAARNAGHLWPEFAACEAALESAWGKSKLALEANNLFGRKQSHDAPVFDTIDMPTHEFINGETVTVLAHWVKYPDWQSCFKDRMALLHRLTSYYGAALMATNGEDFIRAVSKSWSTDPLRAEKVLVIHNQHGSIFQS